MPLVGERQRAAVVVGTVIGFLLPFAQLSAVPAAGQGMTLPPTTSATVAPSPTTTIPPSSTTPAPPTTSARPRSTTTTRKASVPPSTTARKVAPSTTEGETATTVGSDGPTTTDWNRSATDASQPLRTTSPTVPLERAASSSGLSTGSVVALVISGLLAVAMALSLLTVRYVRATRPEGRPFH